MLDKSKKDVLPMSFVAVAEFIFIIIIHKMLINKENIFIVVLK